MFQYEIKNITLKLYGTQITRHWIALQNPRRRVCGKSAASRPIRRSAVVATQKINSVVSRTLQD